MLKFYSALINKKILPFVTIWLNLEDIMPSKIKPISERQVLHDPTYTAKIIEAENRTICY